LIKNNHLPTPEVFYISRVYQTRHGIGFLSNEDQAVNYTPNPLETNVYNEWQGKFRVAPLDVDLLNYALDADRNFSGTAPKNLVFTCVDQLTGNIHASVGGTMRQFATPAELLAHLNITVQELYVSNSDQADQIRLASL